MTRGQVHCHTAEQQGYKTKNRNVTRNKGRRDMSKKSIRFYKDHKVRAVWDEDGNHWWFSVLDIVGAISTRVP